ncbi:MAG: hypothetical protein QG625_3691 [Cyanobacteriota bacterium erpe_2018_sw_39hr_WHONDRS-SW48-000098_B_bin.30]|jgi:hypothetical protein|nr:hypothetical protein [Cyanobacteriota bacterium erpe_2018_sw_39hr_WHONDRS-SW48-000098_B_bin.30]
MLASKTKTLEYCNHSKSLIACYLGSATLLTIGLCSTLYLATFMYSWQSLLSASIPAWIVSYTEVTANFLMSRQKPQILILGSSLSLAALPPFADNKDNALALRRDLGDPALAQVDLLATPGKLISDDYLLTQTLLYKTRQKPQLLVLTYSFRDFHDNLSMDDLSQTPISRMLDFSQSNLHFYPNLLNCFTPDGLTEEIKAITSSHQSHYQAVVSLYRHAVSDSGKDIFKPHQATSNAQKTIIKNNAATSANTKASANSNLDEYTKRYQPFNSTRFDKQLACLKGLLETAQKEALPVVLINMPVTEANRNLITCPDANWQAPIKQLAKQYGADCGDFDAAPLNSNLTTNDFSDCVHLNKSGQAKFVAAFTPWLKQTKAYKQAFAN